jgi:CYTH domain-containing protein
MIENERKYLLCVDPDIYFKQLKEHLKADCYEIQQGYLSGHARVRHLLRHDTRTEQYVFTYKKKVAGNIVEIETDIDQADYARLWTVVKNVVYKTRAKIKFEENIWEIDFFKDKRTGSIYFVMAEVELPEDMLEPNSIPEFVQEHLYYKVPLNDPRFKNKNLSNKKKVLKALALVEEELKKKKT